MLSKQDKPIIYYCEQGNPYCVYPKCVCNTIKPTKAIENHGK
jgi:hypothetical protein